MEVEAQLPIPLAQGDEGALRALGGARRDRLATFGDNLGPAVAGHRAPWVRWWVGDPAREGGGDRAADAQRVASGSNAPHPTMVELGISENREPPGTKHGYGQEHPPLG